MAHKRGNGAHIVRTANRQGVRWHLARVWVGDWELEKKLKSRHNAPGLCPICKVNRRLER